MPKSKDGESDMTIAMRRRAKWVSDNVGWWQYVAIGIKERWFENTEGGEAMQKILQSDFENFVWHFVLYESIK